MSPGGSTGPSYVCIFYLVKNHKTVNISQQPLQPDNKITDLESLEFEMFLVWVLLNLNTFKFPLINLATDL